MLVNLLASLFYSYLAYRFILGVERFRMSGGFTRLKSVFA